MSYSCFASNYNDDDDKLFKADIKYLWLLSSVVDGLKVIRDGVKRYTLYKWCVCVTGVRQ